MGLATSRSRPLSKLTGWYGWDGRHRTPEASPPISLAASPAPNYATAGTKAPAATCASTSTEAAASTNNSTPEPHTTTTVPRPDQNQPRTRLPDLGDRFRSALQSHGSSTRHSSKPLSPAYPNPSPPNSPASPPDTTSPSSNKRNDQPPRLPTPVNNLEGSGSSGQVPYYPLWFVSSAIWRAVMRKKFAVVAAVVVVVVASAVAGAQISQRFGDVPPAITRMSLSSGP